MAKTFDEYLYHRSDIVGAISAKLTEADGVIVPQVDICTSGTPKHMGTHYKILYND